MSGAGQIIGYLTGTYSCTPHLSPWESFTSMLFWCSHACFRKGNPFQRPWVGSCLPLGNGPSEEAPVLTK